MSFICDARLSVREGIAASCQGFAALPRPAARGRCEMMPLRSRGMDDPRRVTLSLIRRRHPRFQVPGGQNTQAESPLLECPDETLGTYLSGAKESLLSSPLEWPGVHALRPLLTGEPVVGTWFDRTQEYAARRRGARRRL
jgi:hypothetical protein